MRGIFLRPEQPAKADMEVEKATEVVVEEVEVEVHVELEVEGEVEVVAGGRSMVAAGRSTSTPSSRGGEASRWRFGRRRPPWVPHSEEDDVVPLAHPHAPHSSPATKHTQV